MHQAVGIRVQTLILHQHHVLPRHLLIGLDVAALQDGAGRGRQAGVGAMTSPVVAVLGLLVLGVRSRPGERWGASPAVGEA